MNSFHVPFLRIDSAVSSLGYVAPPVKLPSTAPLPILAISVTATPLALMLINPAPSSSKFALSNFAIPFTAAPDVLAVALVNDSLLC